MPAASPIPGKPVGLDTVWHGARQAEAHPPHLGHPDPAEAAVGPLDVTRFHGDLPKSLVNTGLAPRRAVMRSVEEVLHGLGEIPQRVLLHGLTPSTKPPVLCTRLRQLRRLLQIAGRLATRLPVVLLHRQIPYVPRIPTMRQQSLLLLRGRQQPE